MPAFLLVEDEQKHSLTLVTLGPEGDVEHKSMGPGWFQSGDPFRKLDDVDRLAPDSEGYIYAVTSHARDDDGNQKKTRDKLVRFRIEGNRVIKPGVVDGLKPALLAAYPLLASASTIQDVEASGGGAEHGGTRNHARPPATAGEFSQPISGRACCYCDH